MDSESFENQLIELVEMFPILYDSSLPGYKNNEKRKHIWNEIAEKLGVPNKRVQEKWKGIRTSYYKHLRENKQRSRSGRKRKDFGTKLDFLKKFFVAEETTETNVFNAVEVATATYETDEPIDTSSDFSDTMREKIYETIEAAAKQLVNQKLDSDEAYCMSLADSFRKMNRIEKERVKIEFSKILMTAKYIDD